MACRKAVLIIVFLGGLLRPCFGEEYVTADKYAELEKRVYALEEKMLRQDTCIREQNECIIDQKRKISEYENRLSQFEQQPHKAAGAPMAIEEGLEIGVGATMIVQGTNNTNAGDTKKEGRFDASYSTDLIFTKEFPEANGKALVHVEANQGPGIDDNLVLYNWVNTDSDFDNEARISCFWYEQGLFGGKALLTLGKLNSTHYFDANAAANDETTQFLAGIFGNNPAIDFPDNGAGMRAAFLPVQWLELGCGVFDADGDWEKIGDDLFTIGEIAFKPKFKGLDGAYRFLAWRNTSNHTEWRAPENDKEASFGFALSFDQKVGRIVTLFTRYGWQDPDVYNPAFPATNDLLFSLEHSWSAGLQIEGKPWGREKDVLAFAFGQCIPSGEYKKAGADLDPPRRADRESYCEAYYNIRMNGHLSISPDLQYIWDPFGNDAADGPSGILVGGVRAQIDF